MKAYLMHRDKNTAYVSTSEGAEKMENDHCDIIDLAT